MEETLEIPKFNETLKAMKDTDTPFPAKYLPTLSDLTPRNISEFIKIWVSLPETRKIGLLEDLEELVEHDTLVNFDSIALSVITDPDPRIRALALRLLWECESQRIVPVIIDLLRDDLDDSVRATAASFLGKFVYLGELDSIKEEIKVGVVKNLIEVVRSDDLPTVRMRALESLGYSSHPSIPKLIKSAFSSKDPLWISAALCAMGRSADEDWSDSVEGMITSPVFEIQIEAIRAAGELELISARNPLLTLLDQGVPDDEMRFTVIWTLSQIGGDDVKEKLDELLEKPTDEDEAELLEKALENLEISNPETFELFDFAPQSTEDQDEYDELDLEEEELYFDEDQDEDQEE